MVPPTVPLSNVILAGYYCNQNKGDGECDVRPCGQEDESFSTPLFTN